MTEFKKIYESLTVQFGTIILLLQGLPGIVAEIDKALPSIDLSSCPIVVNILTAAGAIVTIYGRIVARKIIK